MLGIAAGHVIELHTHLFWNWELGLGSFQKDLGALHFHLLHRKDTTVRDISVSELGPTNKKQLCFYA